MRRWYLLSDCWKQSVEAGGQEDSPSKGVAEGHSPPVPLNFLTVNSHHPHRHQDASQHERKHTQEAQDLSNHHLHGDTLPLTKVSQETLLLCKMRNSEPLARTVISTTLPVLFPPVASQLQPLKHSAHDRSLRSNSYRMLVTSSQFTVLSSLLFP